MTRKRLIADSCELGFLATIGKKLGGLVSMRVWLATVVALFLLIELYRWVKGFFLPLPVYVLAGAFLAIASNYERGMSSFFGQTAPESEPLSQTATLVDPVTSEGEPTEACELEVINESELD